MFAGGQERQLVIASVAAGVVLVKLEIDQLRLTTWVRTRGEAECARVRSLNSGALGYCAQLATGSPSLHQLAGDGL